MACLFCNSEKIKNSVYENTIFNNKEFSYLKCVECDLVYLNPLPIDDDLDKMYPVAYQGELITLSNGCYDWLFKNIEKSEDHLSILDYGCGNGKFVTEAISKNYIITGVEFNPGLVENLKKSIPRGSFLTVADFFKQVELYDIIFLGNVFEHLTNPTQMLSYLKTRVKPNGLLIIEGPVEDNFTLAGVFRKWYFGKRKKMKKKVSHIPWHIFFSNYDNQLNVLTNAGFEKIKYEVKETAWPFPSKFNQCKSIKDVFFWVIAYVSKLLGILIPKNGNTFFFIGKSV